MSFVVVAGGAGCKSAEEKACENLARLASAAGDEAPEVAGEHACTEALEEIKRECSNSEEVLECIAELDELDAFTECAARCAQKR